MKFSKTFKQLTKFAIDNYFILIFLACIGFVGLVSFYKLFVSKPTYVYTRVKMGQGLWWASTQKPSLWFIKNIKKGDVQTDLLGKPIAEILSVRYYPSNLQNQYDVYFIMKLKVSGNKKTGKYNFNRSTIGVGAPVDFEFPSSQFSGTIIEMSSKPIEEKLVEKIVYLNKLYAYSWEYDAIKIGDKFFDGEENVIEILDKSAEGATVSFLPISSLNNNSLTQIRNNIKIKVKLKGKMSNDKFIFGNEQVIIFGRYPYLATSDFYFDGYVVAGIE